MSRETREFLQARYGKGSFGGIGYDLSQEDRTEAAAQYLDKLFEDFAEWLVEAVPEVTTADEFNQAVLFEDASGVSDLARGPLPQPEAPQPEQAPTYRVAHVRVENLDTGDTLFMWNREASPGIEVTVGQQGGTVFIRRVFGRAIDTTAYPASRVMVYTSEDKI